MQLTRQIVPDDWLALHDQRVSDGDGHSAHIGLPGDLPESDLRPAQIAEDCDGKIVTLGRLPNVAEDSRGVLEGAVGKVDSTHVHAGVKKMAQKGAWPQAGPMVATILVRITKFLAWINPFN